MQETPQDRSERHRRIRWIKFLLRPLPRRATIHRYPVLRRFARMARSRPYLWEFRRSSMTPAFYAGAILALQPIYGIQIVLAFFAALALRANLATMVGMQLITNPLTIAPAYFLTYKVGHALIDLLRQNEPATMVGQKAYSLVLGGLVCGVGLGFVMDMAFRLLAFEARKHDWHLPRRSQRHDSASPKPAVRHKD